ncbi:A-kinase anchor protein 200 [Condylostylus longicornis]|uniref:A-kinase anchor protein 200 n=1 Tax=Condylostylus longicornis TaxID=2530218 RepID=UPI00244DAE8F|nr:A-kinase anchor protein 200 [Condylostylus longicornis]XP_055385984.1 A-kinase anchor protein 200 [Condylostylus longicornis]
MGKAQSKRSVDITTDPKKDGTVDEGTGEMKKIEDVDQLKPQVNGDTHHNENEEKEKVTENGETENEKDLSTEKENQKSQEGASSTPTASSPADTGAGGDVAVATAETVTTPTANENTTANSATNNTEQQQSTDANETLNDSKTAGESTTSETPENSSKKPKKEKVKKKWSFRSISFGRKDKQKPSKKEEANANTSAVNGECEKVAEETTTEEVKNTEEKKDISPSAAEASTVPTEESKNTTEENKSTEVESEVKVEKVETPTIETETKSDEAVTKGPETEIVETPKPSEETAPIPEEKEQQSVVENVPSSNDTPVVETEKPHEETKTSASLTNGIEHHDEEPKLNGSAESPKIEVKSEEKSSVVDIEPSSNIEPNANEITLSSETEKSLNNVQISTNVSNVITKDDDNDPLNPVNKLSSSSPPPLPCSPPPSQVMVFALSETKQEQQPILEDIPKIEDVAIKNDIVSNDVQEKLDIGLANADITTEKQSELIVPAEKTDTLLEKTENVVQEVEKSDSKKETEEIKLETAKTDDKVENSTEIGNATSEVIATNIAQEKLIATEEQLSENKNDLTEEKNVEKHESELAKSLPESIENSKTQIEPISEEKDNQIQAENLTNVIEKSLNTETPQNNESNERVEILAPSVDLGSQQDNNSSPTNEIIKQEDTMSTAKFDNDINEIVETIALIQEYTDTVASASKDLIESVTSTVSNNESQSKEVHENQVPPSPPPPLQENVEENKQTGENICVEKISIESNIEQDLPTPPPTPSSQSNIDLENFRENKSEDCDNKSEVALTSSENMISNVEENKISADISNQSNNTSELTSQNEINENEITATATSNNNAPNQKKENGVDEHHDEVAEISATESLNGVDHKTIEDIKSENQQIEKVGTEVITQGATAVAE